MTLEVMIAIIGLVIVIITIVVIFTKYGLRRAPLKPRKRSYAKKWRDLQKFCKDKNTWPDALLSADKLLDKALIKKGFKGKSTGERMVSAQRKFSDNDSLWFAHKLKKKLQENPNMKLREKDVKDALVAFRQALKDLGAL